MDIDEIPMDALAGLSGHLPVTGFTLGVDEEKRGAFLKLRSEGTFGTHDHLFWLPINTANQFGSAGTHAKKLKKWTTAGPNSQPPIESEDWEKANERCAGPARFNAFDDAAVLTVALLAEPEKFTVFRVPSHLAAMIGELLLEQFPTVVHKGNASRH